LHYKSAATSGDPGNKMPKVNLKKEYFVSIYFFCQISPNFQKEIEDFSPHLNSHFRLIAFLKLF
jgi:hypothetical protein